MRKGAWKGVGCTFDWLRFEYVMSHVFYPWPRQGHIDWPRKVLQDHMSGNVWKFLPERRRLMTYVAPHINEDSGIRAPSLGFLLSRIHIPTFWLILLEVTHVFVEGVSLLRMFREPEKGGQWRFVSHLVNSVGVVRNILVIYLGKESWELLVLGPAGVEPADTNRYYL